MTSIGCSVYSKDCSCAKANCQVEFRLCRTGNLARFLCCQSCHSSNRSNRFFSFLKCGLNFSIRHSMASAGFIKATPKWAEKLVCADNGQCYDGECENLHLCEEQEDRGMKDPPNGGKLIICAGPERSGSTWLFNAVRLLLEASCERVHTYWLHTITSQKLQERGWGRQEEGAHIVIKTHDWSDEWDASSADFILLTWRDVCGVVNSYLRLGWLPYDMASMKSRLATWLHSYKKWKKLSHQEFLFHDFSDAQGRELTCLENLSALLGFTRVMDPRVLSGKIQALQVPRYGAPDPVTKLWPKHIYSVADKIPARSKSLDEADCKTLRDFATHLLPE